MSKSNDSQQAIQAACLQFLARREHTQRELLNKLAAKGFERTDIQTVLDDLATQNLQSDSRYADEYARQRLQKGYGALKIAYELQQHGIRAIDLDGLVDEGYGGWLPLLQEVYQRKFGDMPPQSADEKLKCSRFLQQRGFSHELIRDLFKALAERQD